MSTPTVLPWHRIVGIFASDRARAGVSSLTSSESFAALVAENDPHAAQHAETRRLLEEVLEYIPDYLSSEILMHKRIRAHLAAIKQSDQGGKSLNPNPLTTCPPIHVE